MERRSQVLRLKTPVNSNLHLLPTQGHVSAQPGPETPVIHLS